LKLIASYLRDRTQAVRVGEVLSSIGALEMGVFLGGILSPMLFDLFVNDLPSATPEAMIVQFADDTNALSDADSYASLISSAHATLTAIAEWNSVNRLRLNLSKFHFMDGCLERHCLACGVNYN
jgi:hypothetical protein